MANQHADTLTETKYVYRFGNGRAEGSKDMKPLLGGKGANLNEMSAIGLPVPPGYTITTKACRFFIDHDGTWPDGMETQVQEGLKHVEEAMGQTLGDPDNPLLLSVRSGAAKSMPGMMDTVLNLGLNDEVVAGLARKTGNRRFAFDAYRRFIDMFGDVVMGVDHAYFEEAIHKMKQERGVDDDVDLTADDLKQLVEEYKAIYRHHVGETFPSDPQKQLRLSINGVFGSWGNERAVRYRKIRNITGLIGTGVNVQAMVFGNMGVNSGTGVCFTRNPATGEKKPYGEFLQNAQGEDVVAGIRTPKDISELQDVMPDVYDELVDVLETLEVHYKDMQDMEFTIQEGTLYVLQTRDGKRTGTAAVKIAVDMVHEDLISETRAVRDLVEPDHLDQLLHPRFENETDYKDQVIGKGIPASPGAAVGQVVFTSDDAEKARDEGRDVILVRVETSPEDVGGMDASQGILTSRGGMTSHAAVVARGWGKPCVAGCENLSIDYEAKQFSANGTTVEEGDWISINGSTGEVILDKQPLVEPEMSGEFATFMKWVERFRPMGVRANADTPEDAEQALSFGAEGIGLCRTEHMFFGENRIQAMREMIVAESKEERRAALQKLLPFQREDFEGIFRAMDGYPVTIRLLDPPLHEFLPANTDGLKRLADHVGRPVEKIESKVKALKEFNPMLGHRGCRLGVTFPEITEMQARAILEAALNVQAEGVDVHPEIMVPLISTKAELANQKRVIDETAQAVFKERDAQVDYLVGTMIEIPRAALTADTVAEEADFFSFGTNDLTQMTFGFSRDDTGSFLPDYLRHDVLPRDPFQVLDREGVGQLVQIGTERGRQTKPNLKVGICGEHGGEPSSVAFCYETGLNYVSCSPFRVPIARLAAAQTYLREEQGDN